jgi:hypothetical protein
VRSEVHVRVAQPRAAGRSLIRTVALVAVVSVAGTSACLQPGTSDRVQVSWSLDPAEPTLDRPTRARVTLTDEHGGPVAGARLQVEGHMNHPGMAPVVAPAEERRPGVYEADIHFTMAGPWVLVASGTTKDGARFTRTLDVPDVGP